MPRRSLAGAVSLGLAALLSVSLPPLADAKNASAADAGWTWSSATNPAGSASVPGGTSGGGVWLWGGVFYVPGVGHMNTLGEERWETAPTGSGLIGRATHSTRPGSRKSPDIGLIATGVRPVEPRIRVSEAWKDAAISDVAHSTLPRGVEVCHSGTSAPTIGYGGYRCGTVHRDCERSRSTYCVVHHVDGLVYGGGSGGPVWRYDGSGGIVLLGWVRGQLNAGPRGVAPDGTSQFMTFEPVWNLQNQSWTDGQTLTTWGFPAGSDENACFVTTNGCVRS